MERDEHDAGRDDDGPQPYRLPSDSERIWLHPSELGSLLPRSGDAPGAGDPSSHTRTLRARSGPRPTRLPGLRGLAVPVLSGMVGAALSLGILVLAGGLESDDAQTVVERVADAGSYDLSRSESVSQLVASVAPTLVGVRAQTPTGVRVGSGVIFRSDGHVLTTHQLVDGATSIQLTGADGRTWPAQISGTDAESDLCVLAMPGGTVDTAVLGSARRLRVGQMAVIVGAPGGPQGSPSVTAGVIAGLGEVVEVRGRPVYDLIATDATIGSRAAGGPLVDRFGSVVGIATRMTSSGSGEDRLGLVIPIDLARRVAEDLIVYGRTAYSWAGVGGTDLDAGTAEEYGVANGILVQEVAPASPAVRAGVEVADVVTAVDRSPVASMHELMMLVRRHEPGEEIEFTVVRSGVTHTLEVRLTEAPGAG